MSTSLSPETRLRLVHFLCVFAWADMRVGHRERKYIFGLCGLLDLGEDSLERVERWLLSPPDNDELSDPQNVPIKYRELFLDECARLISADGSLDIEEVEAMRMLRSLLFPETRGEGDGDEGAAANVASQA